MSGKINHDKEIELLLKEGKQNLSDAKALLKSGGYRSAVSRSYYSFLDFARAALLMKNIAPHSHEGVIRKFGEIFVKSGIVEGNYGRAFNRVLDARMEADYQIFKDFTKEEVIQTIQEAEKFFKELDKKIFKTRFPLN